MGLLFGKHIEERSESYSGWIDDPRFWSNYPGGMESDAGTTVSPTTMLSYMTAMACISLRARTIAGLRAYVGKSAGPNRFEEVPEHPLNSLLSGKMNPDTNEFNFFETLVYHLDLWGNFYAIKKKTVREGTIRALWQVPNPHDVQVRRAKNNEILSDFGGYAIPGSLIYIIPDPEQGQRKYSQNQILHVTNFSQNGIMGINPIYMIRENAGIALAQQKFVGKFYDGGTFPSGLLSIDGRLGPNAEAYQKAVQEQWADLGRNRKVAVLDEGTTYTPLNMSMADAETVESRRYQGQEICGFYGVPPHKVGFPVSTSHNSLEQENASFKNDCVYPLGQRVVTTMTYSLLSPHDISLGLEVVLDYDASFRADITARGTYNRKMLETGVTPNTIMARENLPPVEGGDQSFVPANLMPLNAPRIEEKEPVIEEENEEDI